MYFKAANDSAIGLLYSKMEYNKQMLKLFTEKFLKENDIETKRCIIGANLSIIPTSKDIANFKDQLPFNACVDIPTLFKKNSETNQKWKQELEGSKIDTDLIDQTDVLAFILFELRAEDKYYSCDLHKTNNIYLKCDLDDYSALYKIQYFIDKGLTEILASEYYQGI